MFSSARWSRIPGEIRPYGGQLAPWLSVMTVRDLVASQAELGHEGLFVESPLSRCWVLNRKRASWPEQSTRRAQSGGADSRGTVNVPDAPCLRL